MGRPMRRYGVVRETPRALTTVSGSSAPAVGRPSVRPRALVSSHTGRRVGTGDSVREDTEREGMYEERE